jgi:anti-anti-sigma factor
MDFKIDTKEKFVVVTPKDATISDIMAVEFEQKLLSFINSVPKNVIVNMFEVNEISTNTASLLLKIQQTFYENKASMVLCSLTPNVATCFDSMGIADVINQTPTESEAWGIVQMEEIERELFDGEDMLFNE